MRRYLPVLFLFFITVVFYKEVFLRGFVPLPADTLVGAYYPWLDSKWGYTVGVPVKNPPLSDAFSQFFLWKNLNIDLIKQSLVPLWNKYEFAGTPHLAAYHTAPLFPANFLLFLPRPLNWSFYVVSSTLFAACFMYLFLSNHIKSQLIRVIASLIFALAGPMTTWVEFGTGVWAAALLPLCLFFIDKYKYQPKQIYALLLTISFSAIILAGHAQILSYAIFLVPLYTVITFGPKLNRFTIAIAISLLIACGLAAVQILPTYDFLRSSIRNQEQYSAGFNFGLTPVQEMLRLFAPDFFGHPATYNHYSITGFYHEFASFLGTVSLPFILALVISRRQTKVEKFFNLIFVATLVLATDNPLSRFVFSLPLPFLTYSYASRLFFLTSFSASILAGLSLSKFLSGQLKPGRLIFFSLLIIFLTGLSLYFTAEQFLIISLRNSLLPVCLLLVLIILLLTKLNKRLIILVVFGFLVFDLGRFFRKHNPLVPPHLIFPPTPTSQFLQNLPQPFRIATTSNTLFPPNTWEYYQLESVAGYNPLRSLSYNRYFNLLNNNPYFSKPSRFSELENDLNPKYLDSLNVKYFLSLKAGLDNNNDQKIKILKNQIEPIFQDGSVVIYQNKNSLPRAYFAQDVQVVSDENQLAQTMQDPNFNPARTAVLLQDPYTTLTPDPQAQVQIIYHQANSVKIVTHSQTDNLLVLADAYDSGWQAYVNEKNVPVYLTNAALRSILVPAGDNQVEFIYAPSSFKIGLFVSIISLLCLLAWPQIYKILFK